GATEDSYNYSAWQATYFVMAALFLIGMITTLTMPESDIERAAVHVYHSSDYAQLTALFAILLTGFIATYTLFPKLIAIQPSSLWLVFSLEALRFASAIFSCVLLTSLLLKTNR